MDNSRYTGKPMFRLLECYVLKALDSLSTQEAETLAAMEPKLTEIYGRSGSWDQIIASAMKFPDNLPELIRGMWDKNQKIAEDNNLILEPQEFAEMFVDQNLSV